MNTFPKIVIFSAELSSLSKKENFIRTDELDSWLANNGYCFKLVQGCYKGNFEFSFCITLGEYEAIAPLIAIANHYGQESILISNERRESDLINLKTQEITYLGRLKAVSYEMARTSDAFTIDTSTNTYYMCVKGA